MEIIREKKKDLTGEVAVDISSKNFVSLDMCFFIHLN